MVKGKTEAQPPVNRPHILVVEDDIHLVSALEAALSRGYHVQTAGDGPTAIAKLDQERFDLVILDLILPKGTGIHVLERLIREDRQVPPVLVISAIGGQVDLSPYAAIVAGQLSKPFGLDEIGRAVREALLGAKTSDRPPSPTEDQTKATVLVVDDDIDLAQTLKAYLEQTGYRVRVANSGNEALGLIAQERFDAVVSDWIMPGITGIDLLERIKSALPEVPVLLMTGYGTPSFLHTAVAAKAADVLTKPFPAQALPMALEKCLRKMADSAPAPALPPSKARGKDGKSRPTRYGLPHIKGQSMAIERAKHALVQAAATDSNVLILGETGTGKELFAHAIHQLSNRAQGPFVVVNAAAIPDSLLESELFGYESGAFTGARREGRQGKFQQADGGTLFLDEIGDLPLPLQSKLLRVLQEGEIDVVGGGTRRIDVRMVAATHQDLPAMVQRGAFRSDLFYRLNVVTLHLPPLRERREDVPVLARQFLEELCEKYDRPDMAFSGEAMQVLSKYRWPGNVRELRNVVERAFVFTQGCLILPVHLPAELYSPAAPQSTPTHQPAGREQPLDIASQEKEAILRALGACAGNKVQAAKMLGISRAGLYIKLKVYGIQ